MDLKSFLNALPAIASSPYALIGYSLVIAAGSFSIWQSRRLEIIGQRLKDLPEKDRLRALELEYKLIPKGGLDSQAFIALKAKQYRLMVILAIVVAGLLVACLSTYKAIEGGKLSSTLKTMSTALAVTKLGKTSAENKEYSIAAGNLEATLKVYPTAEGYMNLGYIYEEISNTDAAIVAYDKATTLDPSIISAHNELGALYKDSGKFDLAQRHLKFVRNNSKPGEDIWFMAMVNEGNVLYEIGRKTNDQEQRSMQCSKAIKDFYLPSLEFRGAIKDQDLVAKALVNLANCYKETNQYSEATRFTEEAISIKRRISANRSLADTLVNMADLLLKQDKFAQAKPYLIEAVTIFKITRNDLGVGAAYFNLGDIAWAAGKVDDAKELYEMSVDSFTIARAGGEYEQAPRRRLERIRNGDVPDFVKKARTLSGPKQAIHS